MKKKNVKLGKTVMIKILSAGYLQMHDVIHNVKPCLCQHVMSSIVHVVLFIRVYLTKCYKIDRRHNIGLLKHMICMQMKVAHSAVCGS